MLLGRFVSHLRANVIAYLALFFALGGGAGAYAAGVPFITGNGSIHSGAIEVPATPIDQFVPGTIGPTIVSVAGFGDIYVLACVLATNGTFAGVSAGYHNTSDSTWESSGNGKVEPGAAVPLTGLYSSGFGKGSRVASISFDITQDEANAACRFKAQVTLTSSN